MKIEGIIPRIDQLGRIVILVETLSGLKYGYGVKLKSYVQKVTNLNRIFV